MHMKLPKIFKALLLCGALGALPGHAAPLAPAAEEKIILIRHGEKPSEGLGLLDCQGLNRALALPATLLSRFGRPDFIFASDPSQQKTDAGQSYNYVRPFLTVAPLAVQLGLPVNTAFGYADIEGLQAELAAPIYHQAVVVVAWEHKKLEELAKAMLQRLGGQVFEVPHWKGSDFDSIYVITVTRSAGQTTARFSLEHQVLDGQSRVCAAAAPVPPADVTLRPAARRPQTP